MYAFVQNICVSIKFKMCVLSFFGFYGSFTLFVIVSTLPSFMRRFTDLIGGLSILFLSIISSKRVKFWLMTN